MCTSSISSRLFQKETKKDKRDKFSGKDYKRLLQKAEKREERLEHVRSKNPEKALRIENNIQWKKALSRAEGQKVKVKSEIYIIKMLLSSIF